MYRSNTSFVEVYIAKTVIYQSFADNLVDIYGSENGEVDSFAGDCFVLSELSI